VSIKAVFYILYTTCTVDKMSEVGDGRPANQMLCLRPAPTDVRPVGVNIYESFAVGVVFLTASDRLHML